VLRRALGKGSARPWRKLRTGSTFGKRHSDDRRAEEGPEHDDHLSGYVRPDGGAGDLVSEAAAQKDNEKRITMIYIGKSKLPVQEPISPGGGYALSSTEVDVHGKTEQDMGRTRLSSGDFKQAGGILGKLTFEDSSPQQPGAAVSQDQNRRSSQDRDGDPGIWLLKVLSRNEASQGTDCVVMTEKKEEDDSEGKRSEEMEILESAEKKGRFWSGKPKARRVSQGGESDMEDDGVSLVSAVLTSGC
jgi:hypothetical protein